MFSVILPVYNGERYIDDAVESALKQRERRLGADNNKRRFYRRQRAGRLKNTSLCRRLR